MSGDEFKGESDQDLLRRALLQPDSQDSRAAASELLGRYNEAVYVWCYRYVLDHDRAMDLSQEVLLRAYRSLATFAGRSHFGSWLFAIARNRCISEMQLVSILTDPEVDPDDIMVGGPDPAADLEQEQDERSLLTLIREHLTPLEQETVWLRCVERMPLRAITRVLGIGQQSGARGVLQQARRKLRAARETKR
jgi:RNA polymerase sigma-70 factor, ECF subfamily